MAAAALMRVLRRRCWKSSAVADDESDSDWRQEGLMWYMEYGRHALGDFSMAVVQANHVLEDQSQLESGPLSSSAGGPQGTFVGIYDGHGGPEASRFINDNLFSHFKDFVSEHQGMSTTVIHKAFLATEDRFLDLVKNEWATKPQIASVGSCCLVGIICGGTLYIANAGDSRVVLGKSHKSTNQITALQLSTEHNASIKSVRDELQSLHPHDPNIVLLRHNVWRVKGIIQVSRSIGDAYLKSPEFNKEPLLPKFRVHHPFSNPILSAQPTVLVQNLCPQDEFLIFASDGLWEHLTNQEAVDIVTQNPRQGIAHRLVKAALKEAANKREMRYSDLQKIDRGVRRHFHDDITVIVLFLDINLITKTSSSSVNISLRSPGPVNQSKNI